MTASTAAPIYALVVPGSETSKPRLKLALSAGCALQANEFENVMQRVKGVLNISTDVGLAIALGMSSQAFANRKKGQSIPFGRLICLLGTVMHVA